MMTKRKIITIDEELCNGCGLCIPNCPEGALQIIDGKARLISDLFCDGLGACIGHCPEGAITIEERVAEPYNERKVMENIVKAGVGTIKAHLEHLTDHGETKFLDDALTVLKEKGIKNPLEKKVEQYKTTTPKFHAGCPGSRIVNNVNKKPAKKSDYGPQESQLRQWPVQIMLVPAHVPYLDGADLLIAADCVPFAYADFHKELLKDKVVLVGCPKFDDSELYKEKFTSIFKNNNIKSITCAHMEVPCCFGLEHMIKYAIDSSGKDIPYHDVTISIGGEKL